MTPAERAAVHRMAGAFSRLSLAAELVVQAKPGHARAALVESMERARATSLREFAAAMEALSSPAEQVSSADPSAPPPPAESPSTPHRAAQAPVTSTTPRLPADVGDGRPAVSAKRGEVTTLALELAARGPFTARDLCSCSASSLNSVRASLTRLVRQGRLAYNGAPARRLGQCGTYTLPAGEAVPELARYGVRRLPADKAPPRVSAPAVPGMHRTPGAFFADKPALPPARPLAPRYA